MKKLRLVKLEIIVLIMLDGKVSPLV